MQEALIEQARADGYSQDHEEETFLLAQQVLAEHGRGARPRGWVRSAAPQLLSGLLWCARHEVPRWMGGSVNRGSGRYQCDDDYAHGQADHPCTLLDARVLDAPITDVILRRCRFTEHAEAVLAQLEVEANATREEARHRQRERRRLQEEVDTLKQNLALTRTPAHVSLIFEQIDRRMECLAELADTEPGYARRVLSAPQVATVRAFLADLRTGWEHQPLGLRHEFVRLILDRVVIHADHEQVEATLIWRTGAQQHLWIERPLIRRSGKVPWTATENAWLRTHYAAAMVDALQARFPQRSYAAVRRHAEELGLPRPQRGRSKPPGAPWTEADKVVLRAYAGGTLSAAELCAQLPGRSWDAIEKQCQVLGLRKRTRPVYYRVMADTLEMISEGDSLRRAW